MRSRLICAVLCVVSSVPVAAQQVTVFFDSFETADASAWWAPARVGETGQTTCSNGTGVPIKCAGTGQDGDVRGGVAWPSPRFVVNGDGTVSDMLTGLVWLRHASCSELDGVDAFGKATWAVAVAAAASLASGTCGLIDGSVAGDWRLPSRFELESLLDLGRSNPALSDGAGTGDWVEGDAFSQVLANYYWSSTSFHASPGEAWFVNTYHGIVRTALKSETYVVWPVRGVR